MADLSTKYLGLTLRNPIVIGSSGLTNSVKEIAELDKNGVGAVVLKSIFEEQILLQAEYSIKKAVADEMIYTDFSETLDYIDVHIKENRIQRLPRRCCHHQGNQCAPGGLRSCLSSGETMRAELFLYSETSSATYCHWTSGTFCR